MVFSDKKPQSGKNRRGASFHESAVTILTPGCHFSGKLYCCGSSRIGGKIEGEIVSEGLLIIEEEAFVKAQITADEVIVQGTIEGSLTASSRVKFEATGCFSGDIATPSLMIEEGALFNGSAKMAAPTKTTQPLATIPVVDKLEKAGASATEDKKAPAIPEVGLNA